MFNPLSMFKHKDGEALASSETAESGDDDEDDAKKKKGESAQSSNASSSAEMAKISTDIDRLKASIEGFTEVRKGLTERMTGLNEQIGELRAMILDRDRTIQEIELKSVKAADLVESVHPDKLMIELQKEDAKFEALKANLEGNESIMERIMEDLKEMRNKLAFLRGIDEIVKLSQEVKKELVEIKKVEATINIEADKVETIYSELRKKFQEIDLFSDNLRETKVAVDQNSKDVEFVKNKLGDLATKDELDKLVNKVQRYIDALQEINKRSSLSKDVSQLKTLLEGLK